jgi:curli biogenesis system outer membrane secretion channel CsgG
MSAFIEFVNLFAKKNEGMMKKYSVPLLVFALIIAHTMLATAGGPVIGQKKRVAVADFTIRQNPALNGAAANQFARTTTEKVIDAFASLKRFTVMDRTAVARLQREKQIQMLGYENATVKADLGAVAKADIYCTGEVQNVSVAQKYDYQHKFLGYDGMVELQLKMYDLSTGALILSKVVKGGTQIGGGLFSMFNLYQDTPSKAVFKALNDAEKKIIEAIDEAFPVEGKIVEVLERAEHKESFLVGMGTDQGCKKGNRLDVFEVLQTRVDGVPYTRKKKICEVEITSVDPDGVFSEVSPLDDNGQMMIKKYDAGYNMVLRAPDK